MEEISIHHRHSGALLFVAKVDVPAGVADGIKLREAVREAVRVDADLAGADLKGIDLSGYVGCLSLPGADMTGADLIKCDLDGSNLEAATLRGAAFANSWLRKCVFSDADLCSSCWDNASNERCHFDGADFSDATFLNASFFETHMENARFPNADVTPEIMEGNFRGADFAGARFAPKLFGGTVDGIRLEHAILGPRFKQAFWSELVYNHTHVAGLRDVLTRGEVWFPPSDGRYSNLWRTWRIVRQDTTWGYPLRLGEKEACDELFQFLRPGDRPESRTPGGFVLRVLIGWIDEYQRLTGGPRTVAAVEEAKA